MEIGSLIRRKRKKKKMMCRELAEMVGVSQQVISAWECNKKTPKANKFILLIKVLQIKR